MSSLLGVKVCTKCGAGKPEEEFYIKDRKTGRRMSRCKECFNADKKERYQAGGEESRRKGREARRRWVAENRERANEAAARWRAANPERAREAGRKSDAKRKERRAAYRAANREQRIAYNRRYKEERAERIRQGNAEYRRKNREALKHRSREWRAANPDRDYEIHAGWKRRNPDLVKAGQHRRRLLERNGGTYTPGEWEAVKERQGRRCAMCGRHEDEAPLCVDHVIPLSRGGRNTADNLQGLCRPCNSRKHTREWDYRWRRANTWSRLRAVKKRY